MLVYYGKNTIREVHPRVYRERGYQPLFDSLPTTEHYRLMLIAEESRTGEPKVLG